MRHTHISLRSARRHGSLRGLSHEHRGLTLLRPPQAPAVLAGARFWIDSPPFLLRVGQLARPERMGMTFARVRRLTGAAGP
jgi:hypothetical protein